MCIMNILSGCVGGNDNSQLDSPAGLQFFFKKFHNKFKKKQKQKKKKHGFTVKERNQMKSGNLFFSCKKSSRQVIQNALLP